MLGYTKFIFLSCTCNTPQSCSYTSVEPTSLYLDPLAWNKGSQPVLEYLSLLHRLIVLYIDVRLEAYHINLVHQKVQWHATAKSHEISLHTLDFQLLLCTLQTAITSTSANQTTKPPNQSQHIVPIDSVKPTSSSTKSGLSSLASPVPGKALTSGRMSLSLTYVLVRIPAFHQTATLLDGVFWYGGTRFCYTPSDR